MKTSRQTNDAHLVATLFRQHKKASSATKIYSLYLIDAIAREARSLAKKAGKSKDDSSKDAGYSTFLTKLEAVLSKLVVDCWENGKVEHRVSSRRFSGGLDQSPPSFVEGSGFVSALPAHPAASASRATG